MQQSPLEAKRFLIILLVGWLVIFLLHAALLYSLGFGLYIAIIDSTISNLILLLGGLVIINTTKYYLPSSFQYIGVIVICLLVAGIWLLVSKSFLHIVLDDNETYNSFLANSLLIRFGFGFLIFTILTIGAILWYSFVEQHKMEQRKEATEKLSKEAELYKLRQQLQPHFLFNSLNSINALIGQDPQKARKMVLQLSDFLRGTLKKEETQMIDLEEEINYLNLYLDIEKVRFGNRLHTEIDISPSCNGKKIPTLLLQPIVENAIKFGLYDTIGETIISVDCQCDGENLVIEVCNPFDPETAMPNRGTGFGLSSIKRRLYLIYARNDLLSTQAKDNYFITQVKIPQTKYEQSYNH